MQILVVFGEVWLPCGVIAYLLIKGLWVAVAFLLILALIATVVGRQIQQAKKRREKYLNYIANRDRSNLTEEERHERSMRNFNILQQRQAFLANLTLEEYLKKQEEEDITDVMTTLGMTREEVLSRDLHKMAKYYIDLMRRAKRLSEASGKIVTIDEVRERDRELLDRAVETEVIDPACHELDHLYPGRVGEYLRNGFFENPELNKHLEECHWCKNGCLRARNEYLEMHKPLTPDCLSQDELQLVVNDSGRLSKERLGQHLDQCKRCRAYYQNAQERYLDRVMPFPP